MELRNYDILYCERVERRCGVQQNAVSSVTVLPFSTPEQSHARITVNFTLRSLALHCLQVLETRATCLACDGARSVPEQNGEPNRARTWPCPASLLGVHR